MVEEDIKKKEIQEEVKKVSNIEKIFKILSIIFGLILIGLLITIKINFPSFSLIWVIILSISIMIISLLAFFGFSIIKRFKREKIEEKEAKKTPSSITLEQADAMAKDALITPDYADYINYDISDKGVVHVGKQNNPIYWLKANGKYENNIYYVLINMFYPLEKRAILINPSEQRLNKAINGLAISPPLEPNIEEIFERSPLTGIEREIRKTIKEEEKEKEEKKEEELI